MLLLVVLLFRIPTFFEPYSYGDEMIYLSLGEAVRQGIPLYKGIHDNKPPLLYLTAAVSGSLFWFRAILAVWSLVTIFIFWKFVELLFPKNTRLQKVATVIFAALTTLPLLEGNIANSELFMMGPTILGFMLLLSKKLSWKKTLTAGLLFSVATLFKVPAAFDIPAIIFYWLATSKFTLQNIQKITKRTILVVIGFATPILLTLFWYYAQGAFVEYFVAAFGQNIGYLSSFRPDDVQEPFLVKNGPLLLRGFLVGSAFLILFVVRKKVSKQFLFLSAWLILTTFAVTLSERPYPHYLIQSVPPLSMLVAMLFASKTIEQVLVIFPITMFLAAPVYYKFWHYPSIPYYVRFVHFATGNLSQTQYMSSFGGNVVKDYKIAEYLTRVTNKSDKIFVWGDNATIYALSKRLPPIRYVADYHIKDFSTGTDTVEALRNNLPEYIVLLPNSDPFNELSDLLFSNYGLSEVIDGAQIWKLLSPGVRALIAP